ncbi:MAG: energy transducer TonB [Gemmatimonadota bacterium]|nr:energy transducer TonB [Gemmatimonadota bacterium]MDH4347975.1 energy transducer TonB [Gemmatimonadota bacterium]
MRFLRLTAVLLMVACDRPKATTVRLPEQAPAQRLEDPPVVINAESPMIHPPALYARGIEGRVVLRLFVDQTGRLVADSTGIAESSGYPAFDSAALAGVGQLRFAPALRNGTPVAALFLLPVDFRHPQAGGITP